MSTESDERQSDTDENISEVDEVEEGSNEAAFSLLIQEAQEMNSEEWNSEKERLQKLDYSESAAKAMADQSLLSQNFKTFLNIYSEMIATWHHLQANDLHIKVSEVFDELKDEHSLVEAARKAVKKFAGELKQIIVQQFAEDELESDDGSDYDESSSGSETDMV